MKRALLPVLLLAEMAALAPVSGVRFTSWHTFWQTSDAYLEALFVQASPMLILAFGMTIVLMSGGIDLSVASMTALVACVMSLFNPGARFWLTAVPVGLLLATALGLFNGVLVALLDVPPIIATLGTLFFYRGLCDVVLKGTEHSAFLDVSGYGRLGELSGSSLLTGVLFLVGGTWFHRSRWRREVLMIGGNRVAARYAAIPVSRRLIELYTLSGILAFLAALCLTGHDGSANAASYKGMELQVIVAVVLGGTSVNGGRGSLVGSIIGVFMIAVLAEGLQAASGVFWIQDHLPFKLHELSPVLLGTLLLAGVLISTRPSQSPAD
jgi:ribose/xylose/arabinose/galactoside ABC-type transport system permease subunit